MSGFPESLKMNDGSNKFLNSTMNNSTSICYSLRWTPPASFSTLPTLPCSFWSNSTSVCLESRAKCPGFPSRAFSSRWPPVATSSSRCSIFSSRSLCSNATLRVFLRDDRRESLHRAEKSGNLESCTPGYNDYNAIHFFCSRACIFVSPLQQQQPAHHRSSTLIETAECGLWRRKSESRGSIGGFQLKTLEKKKWIMQQQKQMKTIWFTLENIFFQHIWFFLRRRSLSFFVPMKYFLHLVNFVKLFLPHCICISYVNSSPTSSHLLGSHNSKISSRVWWTVK